MVRYIVEKIPNYKDAVIVSPDSGGAKRATQIAEKLGTDFGLVHKERKKAGGEDQLVFVGDVNGKVCVHLPRLFLMILRKGCYHH